MAERKSRSRSNGARDDNHGLTGREAIEQVRRSLPDLLGRPVESVLGLERDDDGGGWTVTVQVVELARIPSSTDVLGAYAVTLDHSGELGGVRRRGRYSRNQTDEVQ
jgi:hypothetical protein